MDVRISLTRFVAAIVSALVALAMLPTFSVWAGGDITVDGSSADWDLTEDHLSPMWRAGDTSKDVLSNAYLRYDCDAAELAVLVLAVDGVTVVERGDDAWVKLGGRGANLIDGKEHGSFAWVRDGDVVIGWEGAASLPPGSHTLEIHVNVNDDEGEQTSATPLLEVPLDCQPSLDVEKAVREPDTDWPEDNDASLTVTGDQVEYLVTIENTGAVTLYDITVEDANTSDTDQVLPDLTTCEWDLDALAPGESITCETAAVSAVVGTHVDTITAQASSQDGAAPDVSDTDLAGYTKAAPGKDPVSSIDVVKEVATDAAGPWLDANDDEAPLTLTADDSSVFFRVTASNAGDDRLTVTSALDAVTTGTAAKLDLTSCTNYAELSNGLDVDESWVCVLGPFDAADHAEHRNLVTVEARGDQTNDDVSDADEVNIVLASPPPAPTGGETVVAGSTMEPAIALTKLVSFDDGFTFADANESPGPEIEIAEDSTVQFRFEIENTGDTDLAQVALTDLVTAGTTAVDLAGCELPDALAVGESAACTVGPVDAHVGQHTDVGTVTAIGAGKTVTDTDPVNFVGVAPTVVEPAAVGRPDIDLVKVAQVTPDEDGIKSMTVSASADEPHFIDYTYTITNTGNTDLFELTLVDDVLGEIEVPVLALAPGASIDVQARHAVTDRDVLDGVVTNVATVTGTDPDGVTVDATDDEQVFIIQVLPEVIERPTPAPEPAPAPETVVEPQTLPRTGADPVTLLALAMGLLAMGYGLTRVAAQHPR